MAGDQSEVRSRSVIEFLAKAWLLVVCVAGPVIWAQETGHTALAALISVNLLALATLIDL